MATRSRKKSLRVLPRKSRGTLWLYAVPVKSPMGRDMGVRVYALSNVVYRESGRVDMKHSSVSDWSGALDLDQMAEKVRAAGWDVRYA